MNKESTMVKVYKQLVLIFGYKKSIFADAFLVKYEEKGLIKPANPKDLRVFFYIEILKLD
jgi:hypothetical protein